MERKRIIIASDIHMCHTEWYGVPTRERMECFVRDIEDEYKRDPFDALLMLGDYSLDHWKWQIKGSWLTNGVSYTDAFMKEYIGKLRSYPFRIYAIAGNHEQYGEELWQRFTGQSRHGYCVCGSWVFILLDTYGADLDPQEHSDGTYCGADTGYIREVMDMYPDKKAVLCAHYFAPENESDEFRRLVCEDDRIVCLFAGHNHLSYVKRLDAGWGGKYLFFTGHYSYVGGKRPITSCMWGFREVLLTDRSLASFYITHDNVLGPDKNGGYIRYRGGLQDGAQILLP